MFNIQSYLNKFIRLGLENEETKKTIQRILLTTTGKEIGLNKITYNKGIVVVNEGTAYKNTIFIKKNLLLNEFSKAKLKVIDIN